MTVHNPIQFEVELVERLWSQGWAAFRTASSGPGALANCDVIAMKDGDVYALNVVIMEHATSKKTIFDEGDDLRRIRRRARANTLETGKGMNFGHAIKKIYEDSWDYIDHNASRVSNSQDLPSLNEEMNG